MFDRIIEFSCQEDYFDLGEDFPIAAKINIPKWFKELNHSLEMRTVKGCMPFLDALTSGYILKMPQDLAIKHNFKDDKGETAVGQKPSAGENILRSLININGNSIQTHSIDQLGKCPLNEQNKNLPYHKILNPWTIKTPPGYSCLFLPLLNNQDDRFFPIAGIVDTDTFKTEINFPIVINGYKYPELDTIITKGTPYVQVIPFKREGWKAKFSKKTTKEIIKNSNNYALKLLHNYKTRFWNKKSWK